MVVHILLEASAAVPVVQLLEAVVSAVRLPEAAVLTAAVHSVPEPAPVLLHPCC